LLAISDQKDRKLLFSRRRKKSLVVIVRSPALRGTTKQSDNLLNSLKSRLLRYARNDLSVGFSANCYYINCINKMDFGEEKKLPQ